MKKNVLILFACILIFINILKAQTWSAVGSGIAGLAYSMSVYNGSLYVGGTIPMAGGGNIAKWNGLVWSTADSGVNGNITCMNVYNGELIVGGTFNVASGVSTANNIARWNDTSWSAVAGGISQDMEALAVYNGELYAAGSWILNGSWLLAHIQHWNGINDMVIMPQIDSANSQFHAFETFNNELYVAGYFDSIAGIAVHGIAKWNGNTWSSCGSGTIGGIFSLCEYNGDLYVAGEFDSIGGIAANSIAKWNGTNWSALGGGVTGSGTLGLGDVDAMCIYNGALYVGGSFDTAGTISANNIARWDGTNWSSLGSGITGTFATVFSLAEYNGDLYAGGQFAMAGGIPGTSGIARWSLPVSVQSIDISIPLIYPNPCTNKVHIESAFTKGKYELSDALGNILKENIFLSPKFEIDLIEFKSGNYLLSLFSEGKQTYSKIVKE